MGKAWKFGENLNTDEIIPGRYNITIDPHELASHAFCEIKPDFAANVHPGDVVVGGQNFGCGSSREHAPIAIKGSQVQCVIAASYARIFFRNAINIGLPILECPEAAGNIEEGDQIEADVSTGLIVNHTKGRQYQAQPLPGFVLKIAQAGGLVNFLKSHDIQELVETGAGASGSPGAV
jgi:3-isopropylmalate/(R)-2-methylmalate dehydratase small subunit